ncbi:DUF2161 domain-containing phosphodiesterase [Rossellomorea sp. NS-SX7]|uniref:DUF2161 domain-containing phosphodiesterase n=1 Tax=Rossellomorea sp. NS-SX7 TaxID=3463856 RepID=UPI004059F087
MTEKKRKEADLYQPIQKHFTKLGYKVNGEVNDCDLTAVNGEELVIVELKLSLTIDLLIQAAKRQRLTDLVYIAIPKPKRTRSRRWNDICHLVKRLELGLITVSLTKRPKIEFVAHPQPFDRKKVMTYSKRKRTALIKEIEGRSADYNTGGSNKTKIMTAYKESCIQIACCLERFGPLSPKALKELGTGDKTSSILQKNYYKWFERVQRGVYQLNETGKKELEAYPVLVAYYEEKMNASQNGE